MKLGNLELNVPLALAPMAGITDLPFRLICRRLGCGMTVSEMISAKGLLYNNVKTVSLIIGIAHIPITTIIPIIPTAFFITDVAPKHCIY